VQEVATVRPLTGHVAGHCAQLASDAVEIDAVDLSLLRKRSTWCSSLC
jgi:hypothetical protein